LLSFIGGWSSEGGTRLRSLLVGVAEEGGLRYLGRVGTGYSAPLLKTLLPALKGAAAEASPFVGKGAPRGGKDIHWVRPVLVAELEHGGLTEGGSLRHAAFKGLREDKRAQEVVDDPQPPSPKQAEKAAPTPRWPTLALPPSLPQCHSRVPLALQCQWAAGLRAHARLNKVCIGQADGLKN
jgi:bifunctional non-homologous end joining protein LigD